MMVLACRVGTAGKAGRPKKSVPDLERISANKKTTAAQFLLCLTLQVVQKTKNKFCSADEICTENAEKKMPIRHTLFLRSILRAT